MIEVEPKKMNITNIVSVLGLALVIWSGVLVTSSYIAEEPLRKHGHAVQSSLVKRQPAKGDQSLDKAVAELKSKVEAQPESAAVRTEYGYALLTQGVERSNGSQLIEALKQFDEALRIDSQQPQALLGIASVSLRVGVLDKAIQYYERYLEIKPNDVRALSDYALSLVRMDRRDEAAKALDSALEVSPDSVPVLMVYAMLEQGRQNVGQAKMYAQKALSLAKNQSTASSIENFLAELDGHGVHSEDPHSLIAIANHYFGSHPVIAPKLQSIEQRDRHLLVNVADFPVSQMPEFAKQRFSLNIFEKFQKFKTDVARVDIVEHGSGALLMSVDLDKPSQSEQEMGK